MIQTVTVTNYLGESLELPLTSPEDSGLAIMSIKGLGPPKGNINTSKMASMDGERYNSSRMDARNIVIKVKLLDSPTIEEVRQKTYTYFSVKKQVRLDFVTDTRNVYINGYVESNEPDIFSSFETAQISIICPDPYFRGANDGDGYEDMSLLSANFEFRYSNESVVAQLTEFGTLKSDTHCYLEYPGDIDTGVTIRMHARGPATGITFFKEDILGMNPVEKLTLDDTLLQQIVPNGIQVGDDIEICTIRGSKYAHLTRGNITYNILNSLGRDVSWFQIQHGTNIFFSNASFGLENLQILVYYDTLYEGL